MEQQYEVFAVYRHAAQVILVPLASYEIYANALAAADRHYAEEGEPCLVVTTVAQVAVDMTPVGPMQTMVPGRREPLTLVPQPVFLGDEILWKLVPVLPDASRAEGYRVDPALLEHGLAIAEDAFMSRRDR